ncbi:hypothetical protein B4U80_03224 [Leptotrombidium deliense]|uniref:Uncharacterized protein n=1 Tax=Leptotrombidium deliense TaxID=299467 RepID=A0A443SGP2_9ACAR|nr:hypothetical protein B4U80_03224 [Leptotrombidium deliense]
MDDEKCAEHETEAKRSPNCDAVFDEVCLIEKGTTNEDESHKHRKTPSNASNASNSSSSSQEDTMYSTGSTPLGTPVSDSSENLHNLNDKFNAFATESVKNGLVLNLKAIEEKYEERIDEFKREKNVLESEVESLKVKLLKQEDEFAKSVNEVKGQFNARLEKANKQADSFRKDLESMVVKYAKSEKEVIVLKRSKEETERKFRDALKDKEALLVRIKGLSADKTSLMSSLDKKLAESANLMKNIEKLKEDVKDREIKWKQMQAKFQTECDLHTTSRQKLDSTLQLVDDLKNENQRLRNEVYLNKLMAVNENKENIGTDSTNEAKQEGETMSSTEPDNELLKKTSEYEKENHQLTVKVQTLERERLDHEETVSKLKESLNEAKSEMMTLNQKVNSLEEVRVALERERELGASLNKELQRLKEANNELVGEMEICRHKEGELLEFTERLTAKTVNLQSEHNIVEQKCATLQDEVSRYSKKSKEDEEEIERLRRDLVLCQEKHQNEVSLLARKVAEKTKLTEELRCRVDEVENENKVMKKRHVNTVKELNKELLLMKKRIESSENHGNANNCSETVSIGSRTSSSTSLEACQQQQSNGNIPAVNQHDEGPKCSQCSQCTDTVPQLDKQMLINRILKLQKALNKRQEKIDFLDEHNQQLLEEMKKKTKLIQYYILREETGALTTNKMDENKKQLSKRGTGIMASLYSSSTSDASMTVELSLEINKKLQAVLEDTILKNITLKENINTLGDEIARLTSQRNSTVSHS